MQHKSHLPRRRKALTDWTVPQMRALFKSASYLKSAAKVKYVEESGISMGTFYRWRRALLQSNTPPNQPVPRSAPRDLAERLLILEEYKFRPAEARAIAKKYGINVATLYAWRKARNEWALSAKSSQAAKQDGLSNLLALACEVEKAASALRQAFSRYQG